MLAQSLSGTWTQGNSVLIEAATDFSPDGGDGFFEDELFSYSGIIINPSDELSARDSLTGVIRSAPVAHAVGTFVQEGAAETVEKMVDILVDGELFTGIPVDASVYAYLKLGTYADEEMPVVAVEFDEEGLARVTSAPVGAVPSFDEDGEVLPPIDEMPPPSGKKPAAPTAFSVTPRNQATPDGSFVHFIDAAYAHSGLYEDGTEVSGLHFRADVFDGATKRWVIEAGSSLSWTQQVEGNKNYDVELVALDFANTESDPATDTVSTSPDSSAPSTPTGLALLGGAGGGGVGIIYSQWTPNTETDFDHYEVHASTVSSGFTPGASTLIARTASTNHPISKAYNGSSITTFGYTTTVHVKLKAVDRSGNASAASTVASATAAQAASADITDIQSDNYVLGTSGWRFTKAGNLEANNGTFRGSLTAGTMVSLSSSGGGVTITGSTNTIHLGTSGSGLDLVGTGTGSITFGSNCTISGASTGAINIGTGLTLSGTGSGTITGGVVQTASSGARVVIAGEGASTVTFYSSGGSVIGRAIASSTLLLQGTSSATQISLGAGTTTFTGDVVVDASSDVTASVIFVTDVLQTSSGGHVHIGADTNSTGNFLSLRNTAGTPSAPAAGRAVIFYDANTGANGAIRARNPVSTITLGAF